MLRSIYIFIIIFFVSIALAACSEETVSVEKESPPQYEGTIVAIGDSLTEGLGVAEESSYPAQLQRKLAENGHNYRVINAGVSGETSSGALSRLNWALTLKPDIVILVTGANDGLRGIEPALIEANITKIVQQLKQRNIVVVLGGMQIVQNLGQNYTQAFSKLYKNIARDQGIIFMPAFLAGVGGSPTLNQTDGVHPTADGYRVITENIYPYVAEAIRVHQSK